MSDEQNERNIRVSKALRVATSNNIPMFYSNIAGMTISPEDEDERLWAKQFEHSEDFLMQLVSDAREARHQGLLLPIETILDD